MMNTVIKSNNAMEHRPLPTLPRIFTDGTKRQEFESEALPTDKVSVRIIRSRKQFSFQMWLEMVAEHFVVVDQEFQTAGAAILVLCIGSWPMSPTDKIVVDWRISEFELVDDNETSYADKLVVSFSVLYVIRLGKYCPLSSTSDKIFPTLGKQ